MPICVHFCLKICTCVAHTYVGCASFSWFIAFNTMHLADMVPSLSFAVQKEPEGGHSIECITNAGHSIAFNMYFLLYNLDLWPFNIDLILAYVWTRTHDGPFMCRFWWLLFKPFWLESLQYVFFCTLWPCDLWPMIFWPNIHCWARCSVVLVFIVQTVRQTEKSHTESQTQPNALLMRLTSAWVNIDYRLYAWRG